MKLVTKELERITPKFYEQDNCGEGNLRFYWKLFTPWGNWSWYIAEWDRETGECFGLVEGFETELGYFNLNDLEAVRGPGGLRIERDLYFEPITHSELKRKLA